MHLSHHKEPICVCVSVCVSVFVIVVVIVVAFILYGWKCLYIVDVALLTSLSKQEDKNRKQCHHNFMCM